MLRAIFPQAAFLPQDRSIKATFNLRSTSLISEIDALIDSGATDNFISPHVIKQWEIDTQPVDKPKAIRNVDGTVNTIGVVTDTVQLNLCFKGKTYEQSFYVADLGTDHILLGMPFLSAANPTINWQERTLPGKIEAATADAHRMHLARQAIDSATIKDKLDEAKVQSMLDQFTNHEDESLMVRRTTRSTNLAIEQLHMTTHEAIPPEYRKFGKVFSEKESNRFPASCPWDHEIELIPERPRTLDCKTYPLGEGQQQVLDAFLEEHLRKGYIIRSNSPYASPFFFIKKKDGKLRPVQDYRKLNELTVRNTYPLPLIKELIHQLIDKEWFTKFDIRWGYNNVRIKTHSQWKAAFKTNRGLFQPTVMFFGLTNSPATFQTMMDAIFREEIASGDVIIYMDDILIATKGSLSDHRSKVTHVLQKLQDNDLFLKPEKCKFHKKEVDYLGVIVGKGHVKMDPVKVQGITDWPTPTNLRELRSFLGFGNYYKDFIEHYSEITRPLHNLTKKDTPWTWNESSDNAFKHLKKIFTSYPVLRNPDPTKRYVLDTDASNVAVGATISQEYVDGHHPIAYFSKSLSPAERNYDIYDRELLAIIYAVKAFRYLLLGAREQFITRTDHNNF